METFAVATPDRVVPMRVIVCGLHRTGTLSMRTALKQLGFNDCYHMHNVLENPEKEVPKWIRLFEARFAGRGTITKADFDKILGHSQACVDIPPALFGVELAAMYPEAKVIILNRDPEKWYQSVMESIVASVNPESPLTRLQMLFCFVFDPATRAFAKLGKAMSGLAFRYDHRTEKDKAMAWYKGMYERFRDEIPEERRIEYQIQDGWGPLCAYLGVSVPMIREEKTGEMVEAPFPRVNDREAFKENMVKGRERALGRARENLLVGVGKTAVLAAMGYAGYAVWKTRLGGRL
ncbi:P-loop containing nucleoside triphosphate hydrolase protein [Trichoderma ceciliae]